MKHWFAYIRGTLLMGLTWAFFWAIISVFTGVITELLSGFSLETHIDPLAALALPGFIVGVIFYTVVRFKAGDLQLGSLPLPKIAFLGAMVGLLMGVIALFMGTPNERFPLWFVVLIIVSSSMALSLVSAVWSGYLSRFMSTRSRTH